MEEAAGDPSRWSLPHDQIGIAADVQAGNRRQHHLYGLGPFQGGVAAQISLCHGQARAHRPGESRRQRRREAWRAGQCHLSGLRAHASGREQIPEQAKELGISEADVIKTVMLKETVDNEFTTVEDVAAAAVFFASFKSNALTGQSLVVSHGWFMQ